MRTKHYETAEGFNAEAYSVKGWEGIAFRVRGWETEPDEDTGWSGYEVRTGNLVVRMVGDDRDYSVDPDDVAELAPEDYCTECGQVGCRHDGREGVR